MLASVKTNSALKGSFGEDIVTSFEASSVYVFAAGEYFLISYEDQAQRFKSDIDANVSILSDEIHVFYPTTTGIKRKAPVSLLCKKGA